MLVLDLSTYLFLSQPVAKTSHANDAGTDSRGLMSESPAEFMLMATKDL